MTWIILLLIIVGVSLTFFVAYKVISINKKIDDRISALERNFKYFRFLDDANANFAKYAKILEERFSNREIQELKSAILKK